MSLSIEPVPIHRAAMKLFFSAFGANVAVAVGTGVSLSFVMLDVTGNSAMLGVNMGVYYLPAIFTPILGRIIDRYSTRMTFVVSNLLRVGLLSLYLAISSVERPNVPFMLGLSFLIGLSKLPQGPIFRKVFTKVIADGDYLGLNGRYTAVANGSALGGLLAAGFAIDTIGLRTTLLVSICAFLAITPVILAMPNVQGIGASADRQERIPASMATIIAPFVPMMVVALAMNVSGSPFQVLMPALVKSWGLGASSYTLILAVLTAGTVVCGIFIGRLGRRARPWNLLSAGCAISFCGLALGVAGTRGIYPLLLASALVWAIGACTVEATAFAAFHREVPDRVQGRFFSFNAGVATLTDGASYACFGLLGQSVGATGALISTTALLFVSVGGSVYKAASSRSVPVREFSEEVS
jgi:MFS family permease